MLERGVCFLTGCRGDLLPCVVPALLALLGAGLSIGSLSERFLPYVRAYVRAYAHATNKRENLKFKMVKRLFLKNINCYFCFLKGSKDSDRQNKSGIQTKKHNAHIANRNISTCAALTEVAGNGFKNTASQNDSLL